MMGFGPMTAGECTPCGLTQTSYLDQNTSMFTYFILKNLIKSFLSAYQSKLDIGQTGTPEVRVDLLSFFVWF